MNFSVEGSLAVITGGGTGLGLSMAQTLVEAGGRVVIVGRRESVLREAQKGMGEACSCLAADMTDPVAIDRMVTQITNEAGAPDILINNAGVHLKRSILQTDPADFDRVMRTHVYAAYSLTRGFLPGMLEKRRGSILFIASLTSFIGLPHTLAYSAAKSAITGMVRELTVELAPAGIRVNAIAPGWIDTPMFHRAVDDDPARRDRILARTPMKRFGKPEEVARAALFLCSNASSFVTGTVLPVDGGALVGF